MAFSCKKDISKADRTRQQGLPDDEGGPVGRQQQEKHGDARQDVCNLAMRLRCARHDAADVLSQRAWSEATTRGQLHVPYLLLTGIKWPCSLTYVARECALREYPCRTPKPTCHCQDLMLLGFSSWPCMGQVGAYSPDSPKNDTRAKGQKWIFVEAMTMFRTL